MMHRFADWAYMNTSDVATKEMQTAALKYFFFARNNTLQTKIMLIANFTVRRLVTWPFSGNEVEIDLDLLLLMHYIKHEEWCFIRCPNTVKWVEKRGAAWSRCLEIR